MKRILMTTAVAAAALSTNAHAAFADVKSVVVKNSLSTWLQVSEVVALSGGVDQALAATATATGTGNFTSTSTPDKTIDGVAPAAFPEIYHADGPGVDEMLTITFNSPVTLQSLFVFGRTVSSSERDVYDVFLYNAAGALIASFFDNDGTPNTDHRAVIFENPEVDPVPVPAAGLLFAGGALAMAARRKVTR